MASVDLNRIRDFLRIVELGNITRAAEALGERKAKLSRNLALLEKELSVQLIYRTTRQFRLTDAGAHFYQQMREHIGNAENVIAGLANQDELIAGKIRLTAPEDLGHLIITPIVNEFSKIYPQVTFELIYSNEVLNLVKLGIDVAFRIGHMKDSGILQKKVGNIEQILVGAPSYLEKSKPIIAPEDLADHVTIGFANSPTAKHVWRLSRGTTKRAITIHPQFVANNFLTIRDLTRMGRGLTYMPRFLAQAGLANGDFVQVLKSWSHEGAPVHAVLPAQKNVAKRIRKFYDFATQRF